jgi:hypothetical protein
MIKFKVLSQHFPRKAEGKRLSFPVTSQEGWEGGWNVGRPFLLWQQAQLGLQPCQLYAPVIFGTDLFLLEYEWITDCGKKDLNWTLVLAEPEENQSQTCPRGWSVTWPSSERGISLNKNVS